MAVGIQDKPSTRRICVENLIDAYACYQVVKDGNGQPVDAVMVDMNSENERILGKSRREILGKSISQFLSNENVLKWINIYNKIKHAERRTEYTFYSEFAGRMFNTRVFIDEEEYVNVIYHDISELVARTEAMRESEEKYRNLVEQSVDGITVIDENGYLIEFNRAMENITGIKREDALGHPALDIYLKLIPEEHKSQAVMDRLIERAKSFHTHNSLNDERRTFEGSIIRPDGSSKYVQDIIYQFVTRDNFYTCSTTMDITEHKMVEEIKRSAEENIKKLKEAMELDRIRTEFFANLSHELRTPLNIIFSTIQLIDKDVKDKPELSDCIKDISRKLNTATQNCYRLLRLINNLIDTTKIDAGFYQLNPESCDIVSIVEDITVSVAEYTKSKNIELIFDTDIEEKTAVCDPDKIERIMLNLLSNSIKFTDNGGSIFVNLSDHGDCVEISVEDTGIGIPEEKLQFVFERFRQVDNSLARMYEGSGIGLSLVKSLIEMHRGSISVESEYMKGTRFVIMLPVDRLKPLNNKVLSNYNLIQDNHMKKINMEFSDIYL